MEPATPAAQAQPQGPGCDALRDQYEIAKNREAQLFRAVLLLVYATAVLTVIAAIVVILSAVSVEVAAAGLSLFASIAAGALATMYWRAHNDTLLRLREWMRNCPDAASQLAQLLG